MRLITNTKVLFYHTSPTKKSHVRANRERRIYSYSFVISVKYMPGFLKAGLAKIRTHSTTWQLKTIKFAQGPIKRLYMTLGSKLVVPRIIPLNESKFKMTQILEHLFSNLNSGEGSKRCHFSLEIFKFSSL